MALEDFKFYKIRLDRADMTMAAPLTAKEGAVNGNGIELQVINGSTIEDMSNFAVYLNWKHQTTGAQGSEPFTLVDLNNAVYRLHYPTEMLVAGVVRADIKVVDAESVTVSTAELSIRVAQAATDTTVQSANAWNDIQTILVSQQQIRDRLTEIEEGGVVGPPGADGADGKSAYHIALDNGFIGTEAQWLASLKGADGIDGTNGTNGTNGTDGADGKSAYQSALDGGFVGTELEFNEALAEVDNKQEALVSGTNIKTINGNPILGSGDLVIATSSDWNAINATLTYASADSPTFVANTSIDLTSVIGLGMKIKLTQTTAKYFIVVAITSTTITLYGGTEYTLANAAITEPKFSSMRAPFGFPLNPDKWSVSVSDSGTIRAITPATYDVWYEIYTGLRLNAPIGMWIPKYIVKAQQNNTVSTSTTIFVTLATTPAAETNTKNTASINGASVANGCSQYFEKELDVIELSSKTTFYLNTKGQFGGGVASIYNRADDSASIIKFKCAYL